jgi:UDP-3-O-[3-hydroxymyristoyl] glucosamine N-acyltransferase
MPVSVKQIIDFLISKEVKLARSKQTTETQLTQIASLLSANPNEISFFSDPKRKSELAQTHAGVVILKPEFSALTHSETIEVDDPYYVYALVAQFLNPQSWVPSIHPKAIIALTAQVSASASIDAGVYIGEHAIIGDNVRVSPNAVIEQGVEIGENSYIGPNVSVMHHCQIGCDVRIEAGTVIGGDGFGWAPHQGMWIKIPQIGRVIIGNHVSIGNNCTIDRGAIEDTLVHEGTIIDNLVHIAHNVEIGAFTAIAGQSGFSGSTTVGSHCIFAGQAGVAGHLTLASNSVFMAKSGVTHSIKEPGSYSGFPAVKTSDWQKSVVLQKKLIKTNQQLKALHKEVETLKKMENQ